VKLSKPTREILHGLRGLGGALIVRAPDAYTVFGDGQHDGMVAQGTLFNSFDKDFAIVEFGTLAKTLVPSATASLTKTGFSVALSKQRKVFKFAGPSELDRLAGYVTRLDDLFEGRRIISFDLKSAWLELQMKMIRQIEPSHLCFSQKSDAVVRVKGLDVRVQLKGAGHPLGKLDHSFESVIGASSDDPFEFWVKAPTFRLLKLSDYEVTIYEAGMAEFIALDGNVTYLLRDQRIGEFLARATNAPPDPDTLP